MSARSGLFTLAFLLSADLAAAEQLSSLEALERRLELGRHEDLAAVKAKPESELAPFETDGCSGGLSAGWDYLAQRFPDLAATYGRLPPWQHCCIAHDRLYHEAGRRDASASESFAARQAADAELETCVRQVGTAKAPDLARSAGLSLAEAEAIYRAVAALMYRAVRLGGAPCTGLPWRWGYGWPECD